ncbi:MAG: bacteriophage terminase endonuclease subunit [Silanimonas sp.]|nr:MAG: bacteriophage terminase endonuclease subunit [Silanimonas sp.]
MAGSLAQRHYQRAVAALAAAAAPGESVPAHASAYELMLAQLAEDRRRLKALQSVERKIEAKRQMLPQYEAWVQGVLAGGSGRQDDVLMTVMVWRIDTGDYPGALDIAEYALRHGLTLPDQYQRSTATVVVEEIAERALAALTAGEAFDPQILERAERLTADCDMPDEARAKLHKALGLLYQSTQPAEALRNFRRALALHERVGVKKEIERLERELKNSARTT